MYKIKLSIIPLTYSEYIKSNNLSYNENTLREWEKICYEMHFRPSYKSFLKKNKLLDSYNSLKKWEKKARKIIHQLDK